MAEVEIGIGKTAQQAYRLDDVAIVPSRRTRDPEDVDISCEIDAYRSTCPCWRRPPAAPSPATAIELGRLGIGVPPRGPVGPLRDPEPVFDEIMSCTQARPPAGCRRSTPSRSSPT